MNTIKERYTYVIDKIDAACIRADRVKDEVKLVVVVKRQPVSKIIEVLNAGATRLGENYPEVITDRIEKLREYPHPEWHMIGHIQSRKIKYLESYSIIHSIDSSDVLDRINSAYGSRATGLLEINIAGEPTKQGFLMRESSSTEEFSKYLSDIILNASVRIIGLMCMPPLVINPEQNRQYFEKCKKVLQNIQWITGRTEICELSMGTSNDFEVAIEEGATYVRIGESIMGSRLID